MAVKRYDGSFAVSSTGVRTGNVTLSPAVDLTRAHITHATCYADNLSSSVDFMFRMRITSSTNVEIQVASYVSHNWSGNIQYSFTIVDDALAGSAGRLT